MLRASVLFAVVACSTLGPTHAAQRTFVASYGSDGNACSLAAPCRGFAAAITHTDPGGEIIVLDSAGYGTVTIDKSVSIIAPPGVYAGVSVFSGDGITINGAGVEVVLRGLTINGQGGDDGIFYTLGAKLHVENCVIAGMAGDGVVIGFGGNVSITDTIVRNNGDNGI
jgi:hypothetical protein